MLIIKRPNKAFFVNIRIKFTFQKTLEYEVIRNIQKLLDDQGFIMW